MESSYIEYTPNMGDFSAEYSSARQVEAAVGAAPPPEIWTWKHAEIVGSENALLRQWLIEQQQGALWTTDTELRVTSWLGPGLAARSLHLAQVVGRDLFVVFGAEEAALSLVAAHRAALRGAPATITLEWAGRFYQIRVELIRSGNVTITGTIGLAQDVTARVRAEEALRQAREELDHQVEARTAELRRLYEQAQEAAVLQERQRLARDLHDAVTQILFSASLIAEVLPRIWARDQDKAHRHLEDLRLLTRGALAEMRTLLMELRPVALTEARLGELLQQIADSLMGKLGIPVTLTVRDAGGRQATPVPPDVQTTLYRVAQEALNNVAKHAAASQVAIQLELQRQQVDLAIRDDGKGFDAHDVTADHLGLGIMRERVAAIGGTLTIESRPGAGTLIHVWWRGQEGQ